MNSQTLTWTFIQIGYHLQSYTDPATAPFQGAIMESGGPTARATLSPAHPRTESQWREFLFETGIDTTLPPDQLFTHLRTLPLEIILRASNAVFARYQDPIRWPFQPVIESDGTNGNLITDLPINSFRRGKYLPIPILTGFNTNEGTMFCSPRVETHGDFVNKFTTMIPGLQASDIQALTTVYPDPVTEPNRRPYYGDVPPGFGRQWTRYEAAYAHYAYICPVLQTGHFYSSSSNRFNKTPPQATSSSPSSSLSALDKVGGGSEDEAAPIWIYHFAALSRPDFGGKANHVDEAVLVSHDMGAIGQFPGLVATSDVMHGAWVRFIATGNPNPNPGLTSTITSIKESGRGGEPEWWPRFQSPLIGDDEASPGQFVQRRRPRTSSDGEEKGSNLWRDGEVMMFGADNDERMGGTNRGTPAQVVRLSEGEVDECRFWWERVELSEGMGRKLAVASGRARL